MKNKILLGIILVCLFSVTVSAANGDIGGNIYYTDIVAYMNNAPITSYNIGGRTIIDAEILNWHYGFDVYWYADTRRLEITDKGGRFHSLQAAAGDTLDVLKGKPGDIAGQYFETDIVTTLNGKKIESYNIGGRTFLVAEDMKDFGYDVTWDETQRTLKIAKPYDFYKYETDFGTVASIYHEEHLYNGGSKENNGIIIDGKQLSAKDAECVRPDFGPAAYVPLKPVLDAIGATYSFDKRMITYNETDADGTIRQFEAALYDLHVTYNGSTPPPLTEPNPAENPVLFQDGYETVNIDLNLFVNGKSYDMLANNYNAQTFRTKAYIHDGVIHVPTKTVANFMGYKCDDGIHFYMEENK